MLPLYIKFYLLQVYKTKKNWSILIVMRAKMWWNLTAQSLYNHISWVKLSYLTAEILSIYLTVKRIFQPNIFHKFFTILFKCFATHFKLLYILGWMSLPIRMLCHNSLYPTILLTNMIGHFYVFIYQK